MVNASGRQQLLRPSQPPPAASSALFFSLRSQPPSPTHPASSHPGGGRGVRAGQRYAAVRTMTLRKDYVGLWFYSSSSVCSLIGLVSTVEMDG